MNNLATFYDRLGRPVNDLALQRRQQDVLRDVKWKTFLKRARKFKYIPFVDFVFAAGSMALGNVRDTSDFDVIVGCRYGRIFTARFFCIFSFGIFNQRRKKISHREEAGDKICLNHFVTERSMRLGTPYNIYWQELYKNLVPLYGKDVLIKKFLDANDWVGESRNYFGDRRHFSGNSYFKKFAEAVLDGRLGEIIESAFRTLQLKRIHHNLESEKTGFEPRLRYDDEELEFHPDTKRIHELVG